MTPEQRRRLKALVPSAHEAMPQGGVERARRLFDATPDHLSDAERVAHVHAVLRMLTEARA